MHDYMLKRICIILGLTVWLFNDVRCLAN